VEEFFTGSGTFDTWVVRWFKVLFAMEAHTWSHVCVLQQSAISRKQLMWISWMQLNRPNSKCFASTKTYCTCSKMFCSELRSNSSKGPDATNCQESPMITATFDVIVNLQSFLKTDYLGTALFSKENFDMC
jgi:hypothetical protein